MGDVQETFQVVAAIALQQLGNVLSVLGSLPPSEIIRQVVIAVRPFRGIPFQFAAFYFIKFVFLRSK